MPEDNMTGPTILWRELEGKKVKSNDGKKLGRIRRISQNHFLIEKGLVRKRGFWIPKE
jgi:sporulation protein YlmC with PRC-barrel domain